MDFKFIEQMLLKVSSMKEVIRFGKKEKPIPLYIDPFEVLNDMGLVV